MVSTQLSAIITLVFLPSILLHSARAHRGDEDKNSDFMSLETLPQGFVAAESSRNSPISSHEFQGIGPSSMVEKNAEDAVASSEPNVSAQDPGGTTLNLRITLPYEAFTGSAAPSTAVIVPSSQASAPPTVIAASPQPTQQGGGPLSDASAAAAHSQMAQAAALHAMLAAQAVHDMTTDPLRYAKVHSAEDGQEEKVAWAGESFAGLFKTIGESVIRIQTITAEVNWFQPYQQPQDMALTGSGLAVYRADIPGIDTDPIFITNAHVVRDAHDVKIQLPAIGEQFFAAYVPLICDEFDIAVLQLQNPQELLDVLAKNGKVLQPLPVNDYPLFLGMEVASVGFPLGSNTLKLSRGVISGTEEVGDFICYQTTAPISPGSSGGPLFALDQGQHLHVVGATFASAAAHGAQNLNYVVPGVAIVQVLSQYKAQRELFLNKQPGDPHVAVTTLNANLLAPSLPEASGQDSATPRTVLPLSNQATSALDATETVAAGVEESSSSSSDSLEQRLPVRNQAAKGDPKAKPLLPHYQFQIAPIDAVGIEANTALYKTFGCENGVFISKILDTSVFKVSSDPPIEEHTFLTSVDGVELDAFGMGRTDNFLGDPTAFESLMMMKVRPGETVKVTTCGQDSSKKKVEHTVSMEWKPAKYVGGITDVVEPYWDQKSQEYELFAGITVMELTVNHIIRLLQMGQPPTLGRWLLPENQVKKRLVITHVEKGTYAARVVAPGMVISKVNGNDIGTLEEYRKIFEPLQRADGLETWELETDRGVFFATEFGDALYEQIKKAQMGLTFMFCQSVVAAFRARMERSKAPDGSLVQTAPADAKQLPNSLMQTAPYMSSQEAPKLEVYSNSRVDNSDSTSTFSSRPTPVFSEDRVTTRFARREALSKMAEDGSELSPEELRRSLRAAGSGFLMVPSSEYVQEHGLSFGITAL